MFRRVAVRTVAGMRSNLLLKTVFGVLLVAVQVAIPSQASAGQPGTAPETTHLQVSSRDSADPVLAGTDVTYVVSLYNGSTTTARNVGMSVTWTDGTLRAVRPSQGTCSGTASQSCSLGTINAGTGARVEVVLRAPESASSLGRTATLTVDVPNNSNPYPHDPIERTTVKDEAGMTPTVGGCGGEFLAWQNGCRFVTTGAPVTVEGAAAPSPEDDIWVSAGIVSCWSGSSWTSSGWCAMTSLSLRLLIEETEPYWAPPAGTVLTCRVESTGLAGTYRCTG